MTAADKDTGYIASAAREDLVGAEGVAATDLHPSGTAVIGSERLDVVSEAGFIDKGERIRVVRSEGYRHVVESV
jgi:membrane-bound serine protease (ClpP class)